ncbi:unnamed protein product, partial [Protopolystoma xenopodis]
MRAVAEVLWTVRQRFSPSQDRRYRSAYSLTNGRLRHGKNSALSVAEGKTLLFSDVRHNARSRITVPPVRTDSLSSNFVSADSHSSMLTTSAVYPMDMESTADRLQGVMKTERGIVTANCESLTVPTAEKSFTFGSLNVAEATK